MKERKENMELWAFVVKSLSFYDKFNIKEHSRQVQSGQERQGRAVQ